MQWQQRNYVIVTKKKKFMLCAEWMEIPFYVCIVQKSANCQQKISQFFNVHVFHLHEHFTPVKSVVRFPFIESKILIATVLFFFLIWTHEFMILFYVNVFDDVRWFENLLCFISVKVFWVLGSGLGFPFQH